MATRNRDWKQVRHPSGATITEKTVSSLRASIFRANDARYVYTVAEYPIA